MVSFLVSYISGGGLYSCMLERSCLSDYDAGKKEERERG